MEGERYGGGFEGRNRALARASSSERAGSAGRNEGVRKRREDGESATGWAVGAGERGAGCLSERAALPFFPLFHFTFYFP